MITFLTKDLVFPALSEAVEGVLAVGGDLSAERLILAYSNGIFPWYNEGEPIIWHAPDERYVIFPDKIKISKSMKQVLKKGEFEITVDENFEDVIKNCANVDREGQDGTWIIDEMQKAYINLHQLGFAHSIEVWKDKRLVGGLYGILINGVFCGESMFSLVSNASKVALIWLAKNIDLKLIDCQMHTEHLESMGGEFMNLDNYLNILQNRPS